MNNSMVDLRVWKEMPTVGEARERRKTIFPRKRDAAKSERFFRARLGAPSWARQDNKRERLR
jgi:hypothetical protein